MQQGEHFLEIHVDFDKLPDSNRYVISYYCSCGIRHEFWLYRNECSLMKGRIFRCPNCGSSVVAFGNHFEVNVVND